MKNVAVQGTATLPNGVWFWALIKELGPPTLQLGSTDRIDPPHRKSNQIYFQPPSARTASVDGIDDWIGPGKV